MAVGSMLRKQRRYWRRGRPRAHRPIYALSLQAFLANPTQRECMLPACEKLDSFVMTFV